MKKIIFGIILTAVLSGSLLSDGFVIVPPTPRLPEPIQVEVKYHRVDIEISHQLSKVHIDQVFVNPNNVEVEGRYIFPIPEEASISDFVLYVDGEKLHGEVMNADEALRIYEDIVSRMIDPAILRYAGQDMFEARIYPFPARGERRVEMDYEQLVRKDGDLYRFIYPLSTERFSSAPLEDASVVVRLKSEEPIKNIHSPSHDIEVEYISSREVEVSWEAREVKPDIDFVLYYSLAEEEVGMNCLSYKPHRDEPGYFMLLASVGSDEVRTMPKDIIFVVDRSGSMRGERMDRVKEALTYCVNHLGEEDRFNIIAFSSGTDVLFTDLRGSSKYNIEEARDFIDGIEARGGTNISRSLEEAFSNDFTEGRPAFIVFMTDGYPTVGELDLGKIVEMVEDFDRARVFLFGIGTDDINAVLMDAMAEGGRGLTEYVDDGDSLRLAISSFYGKISNPVMTDIEISYGSAGVYDVVPHIYPDLFEGQQLIVTGRYRNAGRVRIEMQGNTGREKDEYSLSVNLPSYDDELDFIGRYWAMRQIGTLLKEIRLNGENEELVNEIIELGMEFGVVTPYTSYLVIEDEKDIAGLPAPMREMGMRGAGEHLIADITSSEAYGGTSVRLSGAIDEMKAGRVYQTEVNSVINYLNGKTFINEGPTWKQTDYDGQRTENIEYGSEKFFDLLRKDPGIGDFMALGDVIFEYQGTWYKIYRN